MTKNYGDDCFPVSDRRGGKDRQMVGPICDSVCQSLAENNECSFPDAVARPRVCLGKPVKTLP